MKTVAEEDEAERHNLYKFVSTSAKKYHSWGCIHDAKRAPCSPSEASPFPTVGQLPAVTNMMLGKGSKI